MNFPRIARLARIALILTGSALLTACAAGKYDKFGYSTVEKNGRLYVFPTNSQAHQQFNRTGEMGKSVTRIGAGPDGKTIIGPDDDTLNAYLGS